MNDDIKDRVKALVSRYHAEGLGGMTGAEARLLLGEKQRHLAEVSQRCHAGRDVLVNLRLKSGLEGQITEIARYQEYQQLLDQRCGGPVRQQELQR